MKAPKLGRQELLNRVSLALTTGDIGSCLMHASDVQSAMFRFLTSRSCWNRGIMCHGETGMMNDYLTGVIASRASLLTACLFG